MDQIGNMTPAGQTARARLAHLTGLFGEVERRVADCEHKRSLQVLQMTEKVTEMERALHQEIERRSNAERRLAELVDTQIRLALERMSGAFENEMNRLHQRMEQDVLGRFELFEKEFVRVAQRIGRLESTISALASAEKRNAECLQSFDKKVTLLDELVHKDQNQHLLDQMSDQLVKTRKNVQEDLLESADAVTKLLRTEMQDLESRFAAFEKWFRENITPEIIALKGGLDNEMRTREEADEEVVGLLGRYATVMQKHFGASAEVAACGASGAAGASGLPPR